jgi:probable HAF family extracellular repeat protein
MKSCRRGRVSIIVMITLATVAGLAGILDAKKYVWHNLTPLVNSNDAPFGINNLGQVVGGAQPGSGPGQAWIWSQETGKQALPKYGEYNYSIARGINDSGVVVGQLSKDGGAIYDCTTFIYTKTGGMQALNTTLGHSSDAYAINNSGQIVGTSYIYDEDYYISQIHAFMYDGTMHDLGTLPDYVDDYGNHYSRELSLGKAVNNSGQAVGCSQGGWGYPQGVLFSNGMVLDLGNILGVTDPHDPSINTIAFGINDNGHIVGFSAGHAFLWTGMGSIRRLDNEEDNTWAYDINNQGEIVGTLRMNSSYVHIAVLWTEEGGIQNLNDLVVNKDDLLNFGDHLRVATAINDKGWIVGYGTQQAFLLIPVSPSITPVLNLLLID